jgi:hypothetical protein
MPSAGLSLGLEVSGQGLLDLRSYFVHDVGQLLEFCDVDTCQLQRNARPVKRRGSTPFTKYGEGPQLTSGS